MLKPLLIVLLMFSALQTTAQNKPVCHWAKADTSVHIAINPSYLRNIAAAHGDKVLWVNIKNRQTIINQAVAGDNAVTEYDTAGNKLNSITISGKAYIEDVHADAAGNWYLAGRFNDTLQFPGNNIFTKPAGVSSDKFICRLAAGTLHPDWFKIIGTSYQVSAHNFIIANGKIFTWADSAFKTTVYTIDIANGNMTPIATQERAGNISSIAADANGNIYIAGSCASPGNVFFGTHTEAITGNYTVYIVRYTAAGQFDWIHKFTDITCTPRKLNIADNNTIYYTGPLYDSLSIGSYKIKKPRTLGSNIIIVSFDSTGVVKWVRQPNDSAGVVGVPAQHALCFDTNIYILSQVRNYIDWGNSIVTAGGTAFNNATLVNYNDKGDAGWEKHSSNSLILPSGIVSNNRDLWISGIVRDSFAFKMDDVTVPLNANEYTQFIAKLKLPATIVIPPDSTDTTDHDTTTNVSLIPDKSTIVLYPNPATETLDIYAPFEGAKHLQLINATGIVVYRKDMDNAGSDTRVDVSGYPRGIYFVQLHCPSGSFTEKILLR